MEFRNVYQDERRAAAYDELGYGGTYRLAFDALPDILNSYVKGSNVVDFGCGTGRSARFLAGQGYRVTGLDVSAEMVAIARRKDPDGDYRVIRNGDLSSLKPGASSLVLSAFTFDNIRGEASKIRLFKGLRRLLAPGACLVNIVSTPDIYVNEWVTFSTRDFPENRLAEPGGIVRIVTTDYSDARPVEDILCGDAEYRRIYRLAGLDLLDHRKPLARGDEGIAWRSETRVAPWSIYVLG